MTEDNHSAIQEIEKEICLFLGQKNEAGKHGYPKAEYARETIEDALRATTTQEVNTWAADFFRRCGVAARYDDEKYIFTRSEATE